MYRIINIAYRHKIIFIIFIIGLIFSVSPSIVRAESPRDIACYTLAGKVVDINGIKIPDDDLGRCIEPLPPLPNGSAVQSVSYFCYTLKSGKVVDALNQIREIPLTQCKGMQYETQVAPDKAKENAQRNGGTTQNTTISNSGPTYSPCPDNPSKACYTFIEPVQLEGAPSKYVVIEEDGLGKYLGSIFIYLIMLIVVASVFYMIYGGVLYLTTDIINKKLEGREVIQRVVIGLIFVFSVWTIMNTINPNILNGNLNFGVELPGGTNTGRTIAEVTGTPNTNTTGTGDMSAYICPVSGRVISGLYRTQNPSQYHGAVDIAVGVGTQVKAPIGGKITRTALNNGACGHTIVMQDNNNLTLVFCHLSQIKVDTNQTVNQGDTIALSGGRMGADGSGSSQGPHLHFQTGSAGNPNENKKAILICGDVR